MSEPGGVATYSFAQLDAPPTVREIGDALAAVQRESEVLRDQARAHGHAEGHAEGLAGARAEGAQMLEALAQLTAEYQALRETLIAELEQDALALAFELAEQIVAGAIEAQPERVLDVARHALRHLTNRRQVTLIVNPDDLALLDKSAPELQSKLGGIEHLAVQADRRVARGGAIARTDAGEIDSGITMQLARARELVADALSTALPDAGTLKESLADLPAPQDEAADAG